MVAHVLGYARDEVMGKWIGDFFAPESLDRLKENFPKFKAAGEIHGAEFVMLRKDGSRVTMAVDGRIGHDRQGQFKETHCILHDITERKQAEERLHLLDFAVNHVREAAFLSAKMVAFISSMKSLAAPLVTLAPNCSAWESQISTPTFQRTPRSGIGMPLRRSAHLF